MPLHHAALAAVVLGGALAPLGCGGSSSSPPSSSTTTPDAATAVRLLDTQRVAKAITSSIKQQRKVTARVSCPTSVKQAKDMNFVCMAKTKAGTTRFAVTQTDALGHVTYAAAQ